MNMDHWTVIKDCLTLLITGVGGGLAVSGYLKNASTRRAEFLCDLHRAFFEGQTYKAVRRNLDDDSENADAKLRQLTRDQPEEFTDFLNFFELVAWLERQGNLSSGDVHALLGYYLDLLNRHEPIRAYIRNPSNGFEELHRLLG